MKYFITLLLTLCFATLNAARVTPSQLVDIAGKQRMLSQKIAKNYLLLTYDNQNAQSELELKIAVSLFNRNLEALKKYATSDTKLAAAIASEATAWEAMESALQQDKNPKNAVKIVKLSEAVLKTSNLVMGLASKENKKQKIDAELAGLINITSKQSMLSQRLCLLFLNQKLQEQLAKKDRTTSASLVQSFHEMDEAIGFIIASSYNIEANTEELSGQTSLEFDSFKQNKSEFIKGDLELSTVLSVTNKLTKLYGKLAYSYLKI